jgi:translocator protein
MNGSDMTGAPASRAWLGEVARLIVAVAVCLLPSLAGAAFQPGEWYQALRKPVYHPPDWVFGPVWITLYLLMGISAWLVWRRGLSNRTVRVALGIFLLQLALNALWTPAFFGARSIGAGAIVIMLLWLTIVWTILLFRAVSPLAAWLLVPYLAWVSFAAVLNMHLLILNG